MVTRAARAVSPPIFSNFVQGGRVNTPTLRVWRKRDQNNKELWRNTRTTGTPQAVKSAPAALLHYAARRPSPGMDGTQAGRLDDALKLL